MNRVHRIYLQSRQHSTFTLFLSVVRQKREQQSPSNNRRFHHNIPLADVMEEKLEKTSIYASSLGNLVQLLLSYPMQPWQCRARMTVHMQLTMLAISSFPAYKSSVPDFVNRHANGTESLKLPSKNFLCVQVTSTSKIQRREAEGSGVSPMALVSVSPIGGGGAAGFSGHWPSGKYPATGMHAGGTTTTATLPGMKSCDPGLLHEERLRT